MTLDPFNLIKILRGPTLGASTGIAFGILLYLSRTHQDFTLYTFIVLGASVGAAVQGFVVVIGGPVVSFFRFCERLVEILLLRRINLMSDKEKNSYLKRIYNQRYSHDEDEKADEDAEDEDTDGDAPKKHLP